MWADQDLALVDTRNPPVWHTANDVNDPMAVPLAPGITHFMNTNANATAWGPFQYCKDGWWAEIVGSVVIPAATDTLITTLPVAYRRGHNRNSILQGWVGNFGDVVNPVTWIPCTLMLFDNGWLRYFAPPSPPAYLTSLFFGCRYLTNVWGE
jgi:hypothetical protein